MSPTHRSAAAAPREGVVLASPVLHASVLARIRELNADYLELLAHAARSEIEQPPLASATLAGLRTLSTEARRQVANAPYTLFRLHLDRAALWSDACNAGAPSVDERYAAAHDASAGFCHIALAFAWHVAATSRVALRLTYGLHDETAKRLTAAPLWRLKRIACDRSVLAPRWPSNRAFWPQLIAHAAAGDHERLCTTLLLGRQLSAGDLPMARTSDRCGPRATRAGRMRAR